MPASVTRRRISSPSLVLRHLTPATPSGGQSHLVYRDANVMSLVLDAVWAYFKLAEIRCK